MALQFALLQVSNSCFKHKIMLKGIIFDFDGVIAESIDIKSEAFAELYKPYGHSVASEVVKHHEANGGMSRYDKFKYYHKSILDINLNQTEISRLSDEFSKLVVEKVINSPYLPGVMDYIKEVYKTKKLFISTGTPTNEIKLILEGRGISEYFTAVFGSPDKKVVHLKQIMNEYHYKSDELVFYGDSNSDMEAALYFDVNFILIKNKYNHAIDRTFKGEKIENFEGLLLK